MLPTKYWTDLEAVPLAYPVHRRIYTIHHRIDLFSSHFSGSSVVGDIDGSDRQEKTHYCLVDLIKIPSMIDKNQYDDVAGAHTVVLQPAFYRGLDSMTKKHE